MGMGIRMLFRVGMGWKWELVGMGVAFQNGLPIPIILFSVLFYATFTAT